MENEKWEYLFKEVSPLTLSRKRRKGLCKNYGCRREHRPDGWDCHTCHSRLLRIKHPMKFAYRDLKRSAVKRHIPFELSYEDFEFFCKHTGYMESKGRCSESMTVDRIDSSKGYKLENIRALTWADNCRKAINGMTDPCEPIAKTMAMIAGETNWHKFKKIAVETLYKVELIQAQNEGGFQADLQEERNPF